MVAVHENLLTEGYTHIYAILNRKPPNPETIIRVSETRSIGHSKKYKSQFVLLTGTKWYQMYKFWLLVDRLYGCDWW